MKNSLLNSEVLAYCYRYTCRRKVVPYIIDKKYYCPNCNKPLKKVIGTTLRNKASIDLFKP